jgi:hypothetical protein
MQTIGHLYNKFDDYGWQVPYRTDQLISSLTYRQDKNTPGDMNNIQRATGLQGSRFDPCVSQ